MSTKTDMSGLKKLSKNLEELGNKKSIRLDELINDGFVSSHSKYKNFDELLSSSHFNVETAEDFKAIPDDEWDAYIANNTNFSSWEEMKGSALRLYIKSQVGKEL